MLKIFAKSTEMRIARIKKGVSLRDLSKLTELSDGYLSQIETNQRNPSSKAANRIAKALETEFDEIFFIKSDCKSEQTIA